MMRAVQTRRLDLLVIGAGAAGLAAAIRAYDRGVSAVLVVDREPYPGGILRQCIHTGFGLEYFKEDLTGPEYLARLKGEIERRGIETALDTTVAELKPGPVATLISRAAGVVRLEAKAVILASGSYERTRENLQIAGTRPAGVFTAGQVQQLINLFGYRIGRRVVVQGTGDIGLIITRRLLLEGYDVVEVFERLPFVAGLLRNKVQCLDDFEIEPQFAHQIVEVHGAARVTGVTVARVAAAAGGEAGGGSGAAAAGSSLAATAVGASETAGGSGATAAASSLAAAAVGASETAAGSSLAAAGGSAGDAAASEADLRPVPGTERFVPCDTVVLSAGLLPNRELLDDARADAVDANLATGRAGVFVAGNAVEIHDLADGASAQGERAAESAAQYIRRGAAAGGTAERYQPGQFRSRWAVPARGAPPGGVVCIVCPRGCMLTPDDTVCKRGAAFLEQERRRKTRVVTTSAWLRANGAVLRVGVRSESAHPIEYHRSFVENAKRRPSDDDGIRCTVIGGCEPPAVPARSTIPRRRAAERER